MSAERLAVTVIPGAGWSAGDIRDVAKAAEEAGFEAIFTTEVNNDALATAQLMGSATAHIRVGTWIANIYLRHSYTCAKGASLIADDTGGRFILGLGVSHQPVNDALAIDMTSAPADLYRYVLEVRDWLDGKGPATIGGDLDSLRDLARQSLGLYTAFPYFQRMWRESGFAAEADQMEEGAGPAAGEG